MADGPPHPQIQPGSENTGEILGDIHNTGGDIL